METKWVSRNKLICSRINKLVDEEKFFFERKYDCYENILNVQKLLILKIVSALHSCLHTIKIFIFTLKENYIPFLKEVLVIFFKYHNVNFLTVLFLLLLLYSFQQCLYLNGIFKRQITRNVLLLKCNFLFTSKYKKNVEFHLFTDKNILIF